VRHGSTSEIRELLESRGIALKKRFGQNFLTDESARRRILHEILGEYQRLRESSAPEMREVWEIGPGLGSLTDLLYEAGLPLRLFEIDRGIIAVLKERYGSDVPVEEGDFLRTCKAFGPGQGPLLITGNLPYASASAIVTTIIEEGIGPEAMVFLVQKELADRFRSSPGQKDYSALSVLVQNHYETEVRFSLGGTAFYPRPDVGSAVIVMRSLPDRPPKALSGATSLLARQAFSQRRKALRNSLKEHLPILELCGIDPGLRPERLPPEAFRRLGEEYLRRVPAP
jgi:16S rRNA (adenine1518-N6/adenine1519-N6)-dimethyltransferase